MRYFDKVSIVKPGHPEKISSKGFTVEEYITHFSELVELERKEEMERHNKEMNSMSGKKREKAGRAILHARVRKEGTGLGGKHIFKFVRKDGLPETEMSVGDLIKISKKNPLSKKNPSGTITKKTNYSLSVAFDNPLPRWVKKKVRIDLYVNDITYQRMLDYIRSIKNLKGRRKGLINKLLVKDKIKYTDEDKIKFFNTKLTGNQRKGVGKSLQTDDFHLIHGPPGTGKTVTCVEVIRQAVKKGKKVLACADSNTAVDNLLEHLVKSEVSVVRVGHPARVIPLLRKHSLDYLLEDNPLFIKAGKLREKIEELKDKQGKYIYPSGRWRRGLSNKRIKSLAKKNKGSRGILAKKIREMSKSISLQDKIMDTYEEADWLENCAINELLDKVDVVCATNSTSGSEILKGRNFDLSVIDEATQSTEPSCLIPVLKGEKIVLAGDHKQLPPTILNKEANKKGLSISLFERLISLYGNKIKTLLNVQFRMNEKIMKFSSKEFYSGKVKADDSVKFHTLSGIIKKSPGKKYFDIIDPGEPLVLVDTCGKSPERTRKKSFSKENPGEAEVVELLVKEILDMGILPEDIGIITPYHDQADLISSKIKNENLEVDTVDGFQGREKQVIILSLTRSNIHNNIGFLKDLRRLNVSITRAKRKLIIVSDTDTIKGNSTYKKLFEHIREKGNYIKFSDIISKE